MSEPRDDTVHHPAVRRVEATVGSDAAEALRSGLGGADLTSLLLDVMGRRAADRSPSDVLRQYGSDRFVRPAEVDARRLLAASLRAVDALDAGIELVGTAPLVPLGTHAVVADVAQNRVVTTVRSTEVAADPTNTLALEAAVRRRELLRVDPRSSEVVRLAAVDRVVRAQHFAGTDAFAHFTLLGLVTAGRDTGSRAFEAAELPTLLRDLVRVCRALGHPDVVVRLTDLDGAGSAVLDRCSATLEGEATVQAWPERPSGRGYYRSVCFKVDVVTADGLAEVGDGGLVDWTATLLGNRKERLVIGAVALERLVALAPST